MKLRILLLLAGLWALDAGAQEPPPAVTNLWAVRLPDYGTEGSPAVAPDGTIYLGSFHGWLVAYSPEGRMKWKFKAGREIKSSPAVGADGSVYFGSRDHHFYALNADGKLKWKFATGAWVDASPAIAADGTVYFGSWDTNFYALNPDGKLKWQFATGGLVDGSPAVGADGTVYFGSHDKVFYALNPDGKLKWQFATGAEITASPAIGADGAVYFSSTDGDFYALNADGTQRWRLHTGGYTASSPVLDGEGNLYFAANQEQYSLDARGKVRWHFAIANPTGISGAASAGGWVLTAAPWMRMAAFAGDAKFLWQLPSGYDPVAPANISPEGVIYFTDGQRLFAARPIANAVPPAKSSWPLWRANPQNTGRVGK